MTEFDLKAYREWQQSNDRHTFHGIGGEVHALTGIVRALIATHPDPASVERYFEEWNRVESKRLEDLEACRLEGLPRITRIKMTRTGRKVTMTFSSKDGGTLFSSCGMYLKER